MAIFSSVRSQRGTQRDTETTEQLIAFKLRGEWFALPVASVQKVIPLGKVYGDPNHSGISLTLYQGQEITVVDVGHRIFNDHKTAQLAVDDSAASDPSSESDTLGSAQRCLLLVKTADGGVVGIPIDSQPTIRRAGKSQFAPLPSSYLTRGNINCISSMIVDDGGVDPLFLLEPEQLSAV